MKLNTWIYLRALQQQPLFQTHIASFRHFCETHKIRLRAAPDEELRFDLFMTLLERHFSEGFPHDSKILHEACAEVRQEFQRMQDAGVRTCHYFDPHYPRGFDGMEDPPWTFSFLGQANWNNQVHIGIVGSRDVHATTTEVFRKILSPWVEPLPCSIVSGGARGVDSLAHHLALLHHKSTFAWMPSGLKHVYPQQFHKWIPHLCEHGAVLSEFGFEQEVRRHHFEVRNRLIAGMSDVLIVPQASLKSGTMITAHAALGYGKPLWVFPGHVLQNFMSGNLELLLIGASLVTTVDDLSSLFAAEFKIKLDSMTTNSVF